MKRTLLFLFFLLTMVILSGCVYQNRVYQSSAIQQAQNIGESISMVTKELMHHQSLQNRKVILFTPLTNVNNHEQSSNFGRLYSETLMTNFKRAGWVVVDNRKNLRYKNAAVLVGTYGEYHEGLLVNVRLLEPGNHEILASSNIHITDLEAIALSRQDTTPRQFSIEIREDDCVEPERCEKGDDYWRDEYRYYYEEEHDGKNEKKNKDEVYYNNGDTI